MVYITEVHMSNGDTGHEHIAEVKWENPQTSESGKSAREVMVEWINRGGDARVRDDAGNDVRVGVVNATPPYIRTFADKVWTDNLLALPRY
jgi:hypothetical protein